MSKGINKVILIGNLGKDVELRYFPNGDAVANATIATSESWKDKQTGEAQERTEWHKVVFTRKLAEIASQYLKKGSKVYIEGALRTRSYDKDGQKHYTTEIVAHEMQMLDSRGDAAGPTHKGNDNGFDQPHQGQAGGYYRPAPAASTGGGGGGDFSDDIPFSRRTSNYSF